MPILLCLPENPTALGARRHARRVRPRAAGLAKPMPTAANGRSVAPDDFYRDLVWSLRNGVLAVTIDGTVAVMNDVAYRILGTPAAPVRHRPAIHGRPAGPAGSRAHHRRGVRSVAPPEPRRAAAEEHEQSHRLHDFAGPGFARPGDRGHALLQGPDEGRAARRARAAARPSRRARRDGGGDRARGQESARRHRGHGRHPQTPAARLPGRAVDPRRHHQGSEDGQRHRARGARVRAADSPAGRAHVAPRRRSRTRSRWPTRTRPAARSTSTSEHSRRPGDDSGRPAPAPAALHEPADQRVRGDERPRLGPHRRRPSCPRKKRRRAAKRSWARWCRST